MITHIHGVDVVNAVYACSIPVHTDVGVIYITASGINAWAVRILPPPGNGLTEIVTRNEERVFGDVTGVAVGVPAIAVGIPIPPVERAIIFNINHRPYTANHVDRFRNRVNNLTWISSHIEHHPSRVYSQIVERLYNWYSVSPATVSSHDRENLDRFGISCCNYIVMCVIRMRFRVGGPQVTHKNDHSCYAFVAAPFTHSR